MSSELSQIVDVSKIRDDITVFHSNPDILNLQSLNKEIFTKEEIRSILEKFEQAITERVLNLDEKKREIWDKQVERVREEGEKPRYPLTSSSLKLEFVFDHNKSVIEFKSYLETLIEQKQLSILNHTINIKDDDMILYIPRCASPDSIITQLRDICSRDNIKETFESMRSKYMIDQFYC
jgi:vacuolar-type H+-ATPase subunit H